MEDAMANENLSGKVALITGAAGGFGQVLVRAFLGAGAKVVALDVNEAGLRTLAESVAEYASDKFLPLLADIAQYADCERAVAQAKSRLGGVHIVINNGALGLPVIRADCMTHPVDIEEIAPEMWQRFVAVNFNGAWNMTRAAIPILRAQRWGRIIDVTTSFFTMLRGGFQPYGPTKAGLEAMAAAHAAEFAGSGVTVNIVVPGGPANTPMVPSDAGFKREELIQPAVMAPPMLFLCSEEASAISGNRYIASQWDTRLSSEQAEARCRAPIAWPNLAQNPVWPGGKPTH
jgi:NAD(P)-dependent dehydrogenase (short-subunit alcohol dehydrogenase family)